MTKDDLLGKPKTKEQVQVMMDQRKAVTDKIDKFMSPIFEYGNKGADKAFFDATRNGFVFSKETIMRFFEGNKPADYLVVILAAEKEANGDAKATVAVAGVNIETVQDKSGEDIKRLVSLPVEFPATEQPTLFKLDFFPEPNKESGQSFVLTVL